MSQEGELYLKPNVPNPKAHADAFQSGENEYIATGDFVERKGNRFYFIGRGNGSINVGGNKVMPEEVESVLMQVPGVAFALVRGKSNPIAGQVVIAEIVPDSHEIDLKELRLNLLKFCREQLQAHKVPAMILFSDDVNISSSGKLIRSETA